MDLLVFLHRYLQRPVDWFCLRKLARRVFRPLYRRAYANNRLARTSFNGRSWLLHPDLALCSENDKFAVVHWLRSNVIPSDTVIDLGANAGQLTMELASLTGSKGLVVAVEPSPGNLEALRAHLTANGLESRVKVIDAACLDSHDSAISLRFFGSIHSLESGHTINLERDHDYPGQVMSVRTISIDGLCEDLKLKPNLIRIDVEGAELHVIRGALQTLKRFRPKLLLTFHPDDFVNSQAAYQELLSLLETCGYHTSPLDGNLQPRVYPFVHPPRMPEPPTPAELSVLGLPLQRPPRHEIHLCSSWPAAERLYPSAPDAALHAPIRGSSS